MKRICWVILLGSVVLPACRPYLAGGTWEVTSQTVDSNDCEGFDLYTFHEDWFPLQTTIKVSGGGSDIELSFPGLNTDPLACKVRSRLDLYYSEGFDCSYEAEPYIEEDHELLVDLDISGFGISGEHDDASRPYRDVQLNFWLTTECATEECESWLYENPDESAGRKIHDCFSYANDWEVEATRVSRW